MPTIRERVEKLKHRIDEMDGENQTMFDAGEFLYDNAALFAAAEETADQHGNLVMLVQRLARRLPESDTVRVQALDYLNRKGLQGSILRSPA